MRSKPFFKKLKRIQKIKKTLPSNGINDDDDNNNNNNNSHHYNHSDGA